MKYFSSRESFTLIELLVVLAIVAILSTVVIMTLNPAELLKQARDSTRLSDLSTLNTALAAYSADVTNGFMGTSTKVYISIPDTSPTCANLGLPALPTSTIVYTYNCVPATSTRLTNGLGWIPVNLSNISFGSPLSALPIDPINTVASGNYYTYVSGGSYILTAIPESTKQKTALSVNPNIPNYPGVIAVGNNTSLSPLYNPSGLVGYWKFDEGPSASAIDYSGYGNNGTWYGTSPVHYVAGKNGSYAGWFNPSTDYVSVPVSSSTNPLTTFTISAWVNAPNDALSGILAKNSSGKYLWFYSRWCNPAPDCYGPRIYLNDGSAGVDNDPVSSEAPNVWRLLSATYDGVSAKSYINGVLFNVVSGALATFDIPASFLMTPNGSIDDVRLYNRALSAAEVAALYNATK